jgi:adenosylhomocysteine nucleosidase
VPTPAILVGLSAEARIARRLGWVVAIGGGTEPGAETAARLLVARGAAALVSFGLAGGLEPALRPGDIVVPYRVVTSRETYDVAPALAKRLGGMTVHTLFAGSAIAATAQRKQALHAATGAAAVDLESGAVARVATEFGLPFAVLRAICDPAERDLPPAAAIALDAAGFIGFPRIVASVLAHPSQLPGLFAIAKDAARARQALLRRIAAIGR